MGECMPSLVVNSRYMPLLVLSKARRSCRLTIQSTMPASSIIPTPTKCPYHGIWPRIAGMRAGPSCTKTATLSSPKASAAARTHSRLAKGEYCESLSVRWAKEAECAASSSVAHHCVSSCACARASASRGSAPARSTKLPGSLAASTTGTADWSSPTYSTDSQSTSVGGGGGGGAAAASPATSRNTAKRRQRPAAPGSARRTR
mmetsp:Transcript_6659/g.22049  ORF Transcript_6659/g.22049 Transcript_6659/m.22049 type:complete len:203 (-) Transcript_6659:451-1059(-)